jgi:hypothetical protein
MNMLQLLKRQRRPEPPTIELATLLAPYRVVPEDGDETDGLEEEP